MSKFQRNKKVKKKYHIYKHSVRAAQNDLENESYKNNRISHCLRSFRGPAKNV